MNRMLKTPYPENPLQKKRIERFFKTVKPVVLYAYPDVQILRGRLPPKPIENGKEAKWTDKVTDANGHAVKDPKYAGEFGKIKGTGKLMDLFYDAYLRFIDLTDNPLKTEADVKRFDEHVHGLLDFYNRSSIKPNIWKFYAEREKGTMGNIQIIQSGKQKLPLKLRPEKFEFAIQLEWAFA